MTWDAIQAQAAISAVGPGDDLVSPIVWSEVFAACDEPSVTVRWSGLHAITHNGTVVEPDRLQVTYQSHADGGCANTDVTVDEIGVRQTTAVERVTPHGTLLPWPA